MRNISKYLIALLFIAGISTGCDDFLSPSVDQNVPTDTAVQNASDLEAVVYGVYDDLNRVELYGRDFYVSGDVMSDNAWSNANSGRFVGQDQFNFTTNSGYALGVWDVFYEAISGANIAINADLSSDADVDHFKGQAYALRAFSHFNLLQAFGQQYVDGGDPANGVPYSEEYRTAAEADGEYLLPERETIDNVLSNIEDDLNEALDLIDPSRVDEVEMNYWAVRAFQTRYYLYTEQYGRVVDVAEDIINNSGYEITAAEDLVAEWESGSGPNSLFELAFTNTDRLGTDNISRIYRDTNYGDVEASDDLYTSHASDDVRLNLYSSDGDSHRMVSKYSDELGSDNVRVIRFAEVVLNYAEALANGETGEMTATEALNMLADERYEDGSPYTDVTVDDVLLERRLELAMEGHRLYDLIRTESDIEVGDGSSARTSVIPFGDYRLALPIPETEMRANSAMTQNEGYD